MNDEARLTQQRDAAIARLLAQMPGDEAGPGPCLEPEVLAAWMDGTLSAADRRIAEGHAAGCDRCQAMLAAMVRSEPAPARPARWWSTGAIRWAAPLVAGALAVTLWFAADPAILRSRATLPSAPVARSTPPPAQVSGSVSAVHEAVSASDAPASPAMKDRAAASPGETAERRKAVKEEPSRADTSAKAAAAPAALDKKVDVLKSASDARNEAASAPAPAAPAAQAAAPAQTASDRFAGATIASEVNARDIVSPLPSARWRIVSADRVDRSTDGGATWTRTALPAGAQVTAGASPAAGVCWLVGRDGLVLKTVDGVTWTRVLFPEPLTLVAVRSTGADAAVATSDSGASLATSDGGRTWLRLQGFLTRAF